MILGKLVLSDYNVLTTILADKLVLVEKVNTIQEIMRIILAIIAPNRH